MKTIASTKICNGNYTVRTIKENDAEIIRLWKNDHKDFFFYKKDITIDEQKQWLSQFIDRENDYMFIVEDSGQPIGCIGTRFFEDSIDIYNVILGNKSYKGKYIMTEALYSVISFSTFIFKKLPIKVRVLINNPAIQWYEKNGFNTIKSCGDYIEMQFDIKTILNSYYFSINACLPIK